jgi:putative intracellular protease/amidase
MRRRVLVPLPDRDFDVTEVAVPWRLLTDADCEVIFATEKGDTPAADQLLLDGVVLGQLGAAEDAKRFYAELVDAPRFKQPIAYPDIVPGAFDGLMLPGGHAKGMRQYLGSEELQAKVAAFWALNRPVGAICHGVLVLARTKDETGRSVIADLRTTCLPKYMERSAYLSTGWRRGRYYRTYPEYVEDEVRAALSDPNAQFERGPRVLFKRGSAEDDSAAFIVTDGRYVSARWPGDAYAFGRSLVELVTS